MTSTEKRKQVQPDHTDRQLSLIYPLGSPRPGIDFYPTSNAFTQRAQMEEAARLANALMTRLWIPNSTTIVGLLEVGPSKTNYEELLKWVVRQLPTVPTSDWQVVLNELSKRFLHAIDETGCP